MEPWIFQQLLALGQFVSTLELPEVLLIISGVCMGIGTSAFTWLAVQDLGE